MRITYLHQYFNTHSMAGGTRSFEMARRLAAKGHDITVITARREADGAKAWVTTQESGVEVHWCAVPYSNRMSFSQRMRAFMHFAWASAHRAASLPANVVFATSTPLTIALPGMYAARRRHVPMVFEIRDLWPDVPIAMGILQNGPLSWAARFLEGRAYSRAAKVVALTPTMRDFLSGKGVPLEKIAVIPNGADLDRFESGVSRGREPGERITAADTDPRTVLYCGSLGPAHGPGYILRLAEALLTSSPDVQILVVGDGSLRHSLQKQADASGCLGRTIKFVGQVPASEVPKYYASSRASLMTMADCELLYRHSVQNKFFDSLAAGRPVFSNYTGWSSEVAERHGAGEVLPRDDLPAAAAALSARLHDPAWLLRAGKAARRLAEEAFSYDLLVDELEEILESAVRDRNFKRPPASEAGASMAE